MYTITLVIKDLPDGGVKCSVTLDPPLPKDGEASAAHILLMAAMDAMDAACGGGGVITSINGEPQGPVL